MNILITGGNGYVAKSLHNAFKDQHNVTSVTRQDFDLTAFQAMSEFFQDKHFDVVIHCAVQGGSRLKKDSYKDMDVNLIMYYNLLQHKPHYKKLIHLGSGAEIYDSESPYGLSKKIIANSISEVENFYNIRIFAIFDENEWETRFIKTCIKKYINNEPMEIHQNKYMDFFYMEDLVSLVELYILNDNLPKEIDCTYCESKTLYHVTDIINHLNDHQVEIKLNNADVGTEYTGKFTDLGINYIGLEKGIIETYNKLKNESNN
jgi:GDP-L-fucose synthase